MRIAEEIDALEALRSGLFRIWSTRLFAAIVAVVPLYLVCLALNYLAQAVVFVSGGLSNGTYQHYFQLVSSVHRRTVSTGQGGHLRHHHLSDPVLLRLMRQRWTAGVGTAAGRAMRAAISAMIVANLVATILFWGIDSAARLSG